jgi:cyclopropane fatty-acyl-phospholipid synthase-like methyltransferase
MSDPVKKYWDSIYASRELNALGWYEEKSAPSLQLLAKCKIRKDDPILDVGSGASTFIDSLVEEGFTNIIATDISEIALSKSKERLRTRKASTVRWIVDDITNPAYVDKLEDVAVWHDRAVLHFLLEERQRQTYFSTLKKVVRPRGYVIIAAFSLKGAKKCSGLDVRNYDSDMLAECLGEKFRLIEAFDYTYYNPSGGIRPYIYALFQRT